MDSVFDTYLVKNVSKHDEENYKKMHGKNISCIVFTTDLDNPYYINWVDNNKANMIDKYHELIQNIIKANVTAKYLQEGTMVYNFYKYWRKHCPEDIIKPLEIINYILRFLRKKFNIFV